jgi:hypothetical protein
MRAWQGRYRARSGGTSLESCDKCPKGTYANVTGSTSDAQCYRCPDGKFGPEPGGWVGVEQCFRCARRVLVWLFCLLGLGGMLRVSSRRATCFVHAAGMALCKCITPRSCQPEWENFQRQSVPFVGRW